MMTRVAVVEEIESGLCGIPCCPDTPAGCEEEGATNLLFPCGGEFGRVTVFNQVTVRNILKFAKVRLRFIQIFL